MGIKKITYSIIILSCIVIIVTILAYIFNGYFNPFKIFNLSTDKLGHFGDFIGGFVGVILTFLATVLIYLTYDSQKEELALNRKLFARQNFENTFFNMLKVHQDLRKEISFDFDKNRISKNMQESQNVKDKQRNYDFQTIVKGKMFFEFAHNDFIGIWNYMDGIKNYNYYFSEDIKNKHKEFNFDISVKDKSSDDLLKDVLFKYDILWDNYANYLGDYFRNLYHLLKFISEEKANEIKNNQKEESIIIKKYRKYADILQSQMSFSELFLFFYNAIKFNRVKPFIEEFDFIENLHESNLLHKIHSKFEGMGNIKKE